VVYQDHFPPDAAAKERERYNQYGVPEEQLPAELTREELIRREVEQRIREAREREEQQRIERIRDLHRSFTRESDLERFHRSQIEQIYTRIANNDRKLDELREDLLALEEQAQQYNYPPRPDSTRPPLPESLLEDMLDASKRIAEREADATTMREQLERQRMRYEEDLALYREVVQTGGRSRAAPRGDEADGIRARAQREN
jgi:predicted metal-dependent hydrolase